MLKLFLFSLSAVFFTFAVPAAATSLKLEFFGIVDRIREADNSTLSNIGTIEADDFVQGSFVLDTDTPVTPTPNPSQTDYQENPISRFVLEIDGIQFTGAGNSCVAIKDTPESGAFPYDRDSFTAATFAQSPAPVGGRTPWFILFGFETFDVSVLSSEAVPTLAEFENLFQTGQGTANQNALVFTDFSEVGFDVTYVQVSEFIAPAPAPALPELPF